MTGRCIGCGFLSKRVSSQGEFRPHEGFFEYRPEERSKAQHKFQFSPGETNAVHQGELACYRRAADLPREISEFARLKGLDQFDAAPEVLSIDRHCLEWCMYEPGIDPAGHHQEQRAAALERDRRQFMTALAEFQARLGEQEGRQNKRLAWTALYVTVVIGVIQLWAAGMSMTKDSIGYWFGQWIAGLTHSIANWIEGLFRC